MGNELTLEDQILAALRRIVRAIDLHSSRLREVSGLTGPQLVALREATRLGEVPVSVLARSIHLSHPTVTGILHRLEKQGLVERARDPSDRRRLTVRVTREGEAVLEEAPSPLQDRLRTELTKLEEWERTQLLAMLQRAAAMMDAEDLDAAPILTTDVIAVEHAAAVGASPESVTGTDPKTE